MGLGVVHGDLVSPAVALVDQDFVARLTPGHVQAPPIGREDVAALGNELLVVLLVAIPAELGLGLG